MFDSNIKFCTICYQEYFRDDFPHCFDRMVTCGNIKCMGKRRYERYAIRYADYLSKRNFDSIN